MSDRSLRGTRLGAASMESESGVEPAPRRIAEYDCPNGHVITVPFSAEADVPPLWECRCGAEALLRDSERPQTKPAKPPRTHWDMLLERRTIAELEVLLDERLELLRSGRLHSGRRSA
ncbi:MAG: RNA polymerase-binding protein RbpA [Actinomycetota bacterium]